ncbi:hypothetical protein WJX74_009869 [Apatococcus lobatus]|uniref:Integral membrane bound transporter domain-containing protein n=1 Tax=Apatococcus lobatus TaxID=904363 RepID=A0AAW1Q577_9CHLO
MSDEAIKNDLMLFKGVGKKTVACVLMFCLHRHEFPWTPHVWRIAKRLGWVPKKASRDETYEHLNMRVPDDIKYDLHVLLVGHGKKCIRCSPDGHPRKPPDGPCPLQYPSRTKQAPNGSPAHASDEDGQDGSPTDDSPIGKKPRKATKQSSTAKGVAKQRRQNKAGDQSEPTHRKTPQRAAKRGKAAQKTAKGLKRENDSAEPIKDGSMGKEDAAPDQKTEGKQGGDGASPAQNLERAAIKQEAQQDGDNAAPDQHGRIKPEADSRVVSPGEGLQQLGMQQEASSAEHPPLHQTMSRAQLIVPPDPQSRKLEGLEAAAGQEAGLEAPQQSVRSAASCLARESAGPAGVSSELSLPTQSSAVGGSAFKSAGPAHVHPDCSQANQSSVRMSTHPEPLPTERSGMAESAPRQLDPGQALAFQLPQQPQPAHSSASGLEGPATYLVEASGMTQSSTAKLSNSPAAVPEQPHGQTQIRSGRLSITGDAHVHSAPRETSQQPHGYGMAVNDIQAVSMTDERSQSSSWPISMPQIRPGRLCTSSESSETDSHQGQPVHKLRHHSEATQKAPGANLKRHEGLPQLPAPPDGLAERAQRGSGQQLQLPSAASEPAHGRDSSGGNGSEVAFESCHSHTPSPASASHVTRASLVANAPSGNASPTSAWDGRSSDASLGARPTSGSTLAEATPGPHAVLQMQAPGADDHPGSGAGRQPSAQEPARKFPWRPGPLGQAWDWFRNFLLSAEFQQMLQLAAGQLVLALFVFVKPMQFYESCLAVIFYVAAVLLVGRRQNVGSRLQAAANTFGWFWPGLVLGGGVVSLARALQHVVYPLWLAIFTTLVLIPVAVVRVYDLGLGIISGLVFGIVVLLAESLWPAKTLWRMGVTNFLFVGLCASGGTVFTGLFVMPTLARDEMRSEVEGLVRGIGQSLSGYASHMFVPDKPPGDQDDPENMTASRRRLLQASMQEEIASDEQYDKIVWESSDPKLNTPPRHTGTAFSPPVTGLRPKMFMARLLLGDAKFEPPWLSWQQVPLDKWKVVLDKLDRLLIQIAALESVLEGPEPLLCERDVEEALGHSVIPIFRLIYAQLAGALAALARSIHTDLHHARQMRHLQVLFEPCWGMLELELASAMHSTIKSYGALYNGQSPSNLYKPVPLVRAVMYVQTLTSGIMEAVADTEAAIVAALGHKYTLKRADPPERPLEPVATEPVHQAVQIPTAEPADVLPERLSSSFGGSGGQRSSSDLLPPSPTEHTGAHSQSIQVASLASFTDSGSSFHTPVTPPSGSNIKPGSGTGRLHPRRHNRTSNLGPSRATTAQPNVLHPHDPIPNASMGRYLDEQRATFSQQSSYAADAYHHSPSRRSPLARARREYQQASVSSQDSREGSGHAGSATIRSQQSHLGQDHAEELQVVHVQQSPPYESTQDSSVTNQSSPQAALGQGDVASELQTEQSSRSMSDSDRQTGGSNAQRGYPSKSSLYAQSRHTLQRPVPGSAMPGPLSGATLDCPQDPSWHAPFREEQGSARHGKTLYPAANQVDLSMGSQAAQHADIAHPDDMAATLQPSGWDVAVGDLPPASPHSQVASPVSLSQRSVGSSSAHEAQSIPEHHTGTGSARSQYDIQAPSRSLGLQDASQAAAATAAGDAPQAQQQDPLRPAFKGSVTRGHSKRALEPPPEAILDDVSDFYSESNDEMLVLEAGRRLGAGSLSPGSGHQTPDASRPLSSRGGPSPRDMASLRSPPGWRAVTEDSPPASRESSITWARQGVAGYVASLVGTWERLISSAPSTRRSLGAEPTDTLRQPDVTSSQAREAPQTDPRPLPHAQQASRAMETFSTISPMLPYREAEEANILDTRENLLTSQDISPSILATKLDSFGDTIGDTFAESFGDALSDTQNLEHQHGIMDGLDTAYNPDAPGPSNFDTGSSDQGHLMWAMGSMSQDPIATCSSFREDGDPQQCAANGEQFIRRLGTAGPSLGNSQQQLPAGSSHRPLTAQHPRGMQSGVVVQPFERTLPDCLIERDSVHHIIDVDGDGSPSSHSALRIRGGAASAVSSSPRSMPLRSNDQDVNMRHADRHGAAGWLAGTHNADGDSIQDEDIRAGDVLRTASWAGDAQDADISIGDGISANSRSGYEDEDWIHCGGEPVSAGSLDEDDAIIGGTSIAYDVTSAGSVADIEHGHTARGSGTSAGYVRTSVGHAISERELSGAGGDGDIPRPPRFASMRRSVQERPLWRVPHSRFGSLDDLADHLRVHSSRRLSVQDVKGGQPPKRQGRGQQWKAWWWLQIAWLLPLLQALTGWVLVPITRDVCKKVVASCKTRKAFVDNTWHNRYFQFGVKYWLAYALAMAIIIPLQYISTGFVKWAPYYVMITVVVVLCEKVETTLFKGLVRISTTIGGCLVGFLFMLRADLATNPYGLMVLLCAFTFMTGYWSLGPFKYGIFLLLITSNALVLCQYVPTPGHHGSVLQFYARIADIAVGVIYCILIDLIWPWYTSSAALESMGAAFKRCTILMGAFNGQFAEELKVAHVPRDQRVEAKGIAGKDPFTLQGAVYAPLGGVSLMMKLNSVIWEKVLLGTPPIVHRTIALVRVLADRLTAVEVMLQQKPIITGRFTSAPYERFMQPMEEELKAVGKAMVRLGEAVVAVLSERGSAREMTALQQAIDLVQDKRLSFRRKYLHLQHDLAVAVGEDNSSRPLPNESAVDCLSTATLHMQPTDPMHPIEVQDEGVGQRHMVAAFTTPDDAVRFLSFIYALSKAVDKATLLARTIITDEWILRSRREKNVQQRLLWLGLGRKKHRQQAGEQSV